MRSLRNWMAAGVGAIALAALGVGVVFGSWGEGVGTDAVEVDGTVRMVDTQYWIDGTLTALCAVPATCTVYDAEGEGSWRLDFGQHDYFLPGGFSVGDHTIQGKLAAGGEIDIYVVDGTSVGRGEGEPPPWGGPDSDGGGATDDIEAAEGGDPLDPADDAAILALDTDDDGCSNGQELGPDETAGGLRDPLNPWDFFDPNGAPQRDGVININDIFLVAARFGTTGDPNGDPLTTPPKTGYHTAYDRTFLGPNPWNLGPADGAIGINEIFWVAAQFAHVCA